MEQGVKMRDYTKTEDYYKKVFEQDSYFIESSENDLIEILEEKGPDFENIPLCYIDIADNYFLRFYLSYTMGKSYEELLPDVKKYIENACTGWTGKNYEELVRICSMSILFNIRNGYIEKLIKKAEARLNTLMYGELFVKLLEPSWDVKATETYYADDKALVEVIQLAKTDKTAAVLRLKKYVDKQWFKTLKEGIITNTSKCYRGYWCIEAAALVKALGLDDSELKDCKYYPYDMAHFCE